MRQPFEIHLKTTAVEHQGKETPYCTSNKTRFAATMLGRWASAACAVQQEKSKVCV